MSGDHAKALLQGQSDERAPLLEVCIASVEDAIAASRGGADRLELISAMELGGLTPSLGLFESVRRAVDLPIVVMLRSRAAGFRYSDHDQAVMLRDAERLLEAGAHGLVSGGLSESGELSEGYWKSLRSLSQGRELVFHRAIDVADDPLRLLAQLIDHGTTRVLTSGGRATAWEGRQQIATMRDRARGRIEILAGSGVRADNAYDLMKATGCRQLHGTFQRGVNDPAGVVGDSRRPVTDERKVAATRLAMRRTD